MHTYDVTEIKVRANKNAPRIWLETRRLERSGFAPGTRYTLSTGDARVVLTVADDGSRVVSSHKKGDSVLPVIDLNSAAAIGCFEGLDKVRVIFRRDEIHILPLATQKKAAERIDRVERKLRAGEPLRIVSLCHGGGVLSKALHDGMARAGVDTHLAMANDIDPEVLHHAAEVNPVWRADTLAVSAPLQEIMCDEYLMRAVGTADVCEAGLPCVGASIAGRSKKHLSMAEEDPRVGHLVVPFLALIERWQPAVIVLENVVPYAATASVHIIEHSLRDWGYSVQKCELSAHDDFGCLEDRKRMCLVAVTAGLQFDIGSIRKTGQPSHRLGDVLEPVADDAECWSDMTYLRDKEERDKEAGKGFRMSILGPDATRVGTIGAGYAKCRSTEVKIAHPSPEDDRLRQLLPIEHARCKGVDPRLIEGLPATRAHKLLGNSVAVPPFEAAGEAIGAALRRLVKHGRVKPVTVVDVLPVAQLELVA